MVARLAGLKLRLLWNGLKADRQRTFGFPIMIGVLGYGSWRLAGLYRDAMGGLSPEAALQMSLWSALGFWALWVALPVVIFPLDENLDPAQFALAPVSRRQLVAGLGTAALVAPSIVIPAIVLGANVAEFREVAIAVAVSTLLMIGILVVSGQLFTTVISAVLRTRRGRDISTLIVAGIGMAGFGAQVLVRNEVTERGLEGALLSNALGAEGLLLPPVAAQRVVTEAMSGDLLGSIGSGIVALGWIAAAAWVWQRLLGWMLTTPQNSPRPSRSRATQGLAGGGGSWSPQLVLARKELRFYVRDPRQRLVWTGAVIFIGLAAASILVGTGGLAAFRTRTWLPLLAPVLVLFVGLPIALNFFGWERNAASFLFVMPVSPRRMLLGKNLAATIALAIETAALGLILAWLSDSWLILQLLPALTLCAIGCQLAVGNMVSVITPLRLPREGTDVFAQASEQGCLALVAQVLSFGAIGLLLVLPASITVLTVSFNSPIPVWFTSLFAVLWGVLFWALSMWLAGMILKRRLPEVVNWVQVV